MAWSLVQQASSQATATTAVSLPNPSTAGNLLIATVSSGSGTAITGPANWSSVVHVANSTTVEAYIFAYYDNPGSISTFTMSGGTGSGQLDIAEFSCTSVASVAAASDTGTQTGTAVGQITITTGGTAKANDLAIVCALEHLSSANSITWTDPTGFTEFSSLNVGSSTNHQYAARNLAVTSGGAQSVIAKSSVSSATNGWAGVVATFSQPSTQYNQSCTTSATASAIQQVQVGRMLTVLATASGTVQRLISRALAVTATATGAQAVRIGKQLAALATAAGTGRLQPGKYLAATVTASPALVRALATHLAATATATGAQAVRIGKRLAATATASGTLTTARVKLLTLAGTVTASATQAVRIGKQLAATATALPSLVREISRSLAAQVTASAAQRLQVGKSLAAQVSASPALVRKLARSLAVTVTASGAIRRGVGKVLSVLADALAALGIQANQGARLPGSVTLSDSLAETVALAVTAPAASLSDALAGAMSSGDSLAGAVAVSDVLEGAVSVGDSP